MYLSWRASKSRLKEAENARKNRAEIVKAWSQGQITRRDLIKMGLITAGGTLVLKNGLSPFARSAFAAVPTGTPPSPIPTGLEFTQAMPRLTLQSPMAVSALNPAPTREANTTFNAAKGIGPIEGRPPGEGWAHQRWEEFFPKVAYEVSQAPVPAGTRILHPSFPPQQANKIWTFNGTLPFPLFKARYGEPMLVRHHNRLPLDPADNGGFGRNEITTHFHNGHTPAESDGFAGAFFFPQQFYDYHWPHVLAGHDSINPNATDPRAGGPDDSGGIVKVPGDWREIESTMWFHDHRFDFTSHNVYKGNAGMLNLYSSVDRGNEAINDGVNLRLPSGTALSWGNLDYDINLLISDKALDRDGQLFFDIFDTDGFLGDLMTVNGAYKPFFEVERRKYRFRILNAGVARFLKLAIANGSGKAVPMRFIANDGNLLSAPLTLTELDQQGIAERYDIVVDFSAFSIGSKLWMVNLAEHSNGTRPDRNVKLSDALAGRSSDPGVGKFLEFRVVRNPAQADQSQVPSVLIPSPPVLPFVRERFFTFSRRAEPAPWRIRVDGGEALPFDVNRVSVLPGHSVVERWHLINEGVTWDHPVHIHFEEGITLLRDGRTPPAHENLARKDVWRLRPGGTVTIQFQFREFFGEYVEHCHNTTHEDHAMLLRWDLTGNLVPLPTPIPTPAGVTFTEPEVLPEAR